MKVSGLADMLMRAWQRKSPLAIALLPLSWLYLSLVTTRRVLYALGWFRQETLPVPVIVVGNIFVGGTGKTPFVIWLVEQLRERGFRPGVISRGYGGRAPAYPFDVNAQPDPALAGDEPVLMALRSGVPVMHKPFQADALLRVITLQLSVNPTDVTSPRCSSA